MVTTAAPTLLPTAPVREPVPADPVRLGVRLRAAIGRADDLVGAAAVAELRAGLAWTAAAGETCRITRPVDAVRRAITALRAGDEAAARVALDHAVAALREAPALPLPRPATSFERRSI
ncbi:hypothetical protein [Actinokineospora enzanensis]|uniref:hypothetical protein n=1 Tax=Actinokineospora enzanensis TaxID=155975 RepID=UPI00035FB3FE|nr:hypothetical protein [Actinokineospora enzanensis]